MNLHEYAYLSKLAYRLDDHESENQWRRRLFYALSRHGFALVSTFDRLDTQGFIARRGTDIVIAFRGTEVARGEDVRTDLSIWPRRDRIGHAHSGISIALDHVWLTIHAHLASLESVPGATIHLTGHSLGGMLAKLAAVRLLRSHNVGSLVTFGAPPVLSRFPSKMLSRMLAPKCIRVQSADAVTMTLRLLYRSAGTRTYIDRKGRVIERAGCYVALLDRLAIVSAETRRRLGSLCRGNFRDAFARSKFATNHSINRYLKSLEPNPPHASAS